MSGYDVTPDSLRYDRQNWVMGVIVICVLIVIIISFTIAAIKAATEISSIHSHIKAECITFFRTNDLMPERLKLPTPGGCAQYRHLVPLPTPKAIYLNA